MSAHKEEIARLRKMAYKGVKGLKSIVEDDHSDFACYEDIIENIKILKEVLNDVENIAVIEGILTFDEILKYMDEGDNIFYMVEYEAENLASYLYNTPYKKQNDIQISERIKAIFVMIEDVIKRFVSVFYKLTKLQKDS